MAEGQGSKNSLGLAEQYTIVLEPQGNDGFRGRTLELPFVMGFGRTSDECVARLRESLAFAIETMAKEGVDPPVPASESKRDEQVNIKLTRHERAFFNEAARREGFRSVADFMRSLAMRRLR